MLQLASPSVTLGAPSPGSPLEQLHALADRELALLAHVVGEHLPVELVELVLALRAERAALEARLDLDTLAHDALL